MPNPFVVETVPCLRIPIPEAIRPEPLLSPAVVLPDISRQTVSLTLEALPAATRIPYVVPLGGLSTGAATVFVKIRAFKCPVALRQLSRIPFPLVWLI